MGSKKPTPPPGKSLLQMGIVSPPPPPKKVPTSDPVGSYATPSAPISTPQTPRDSSDASTAVIIEHCSGLTTDSVPHRKARAAGFTFYFAMMPAGDYVFHRLRPNWQEGYGGRTVRFLMQDGSIERVKGPFSERPYDYEMPLLVQATGDETLGAPPACRIKVGRNLCHYLSRCCVPDVVFEESEFSVRPIGERVRREWRGLELAIVGRWSTRHTTVDEILDIIREGRE